MIGAMKRFGALALLVGLLLPGTAEAGLKFCNHRNYPVVAALGFYDHGGPAPGLGWSSQGWWVIQPGKCATVMGRLENAVYYYYGFNRKQNVVWAGREGEGGKVFCFKNKSFRIPLSGREACEKAALEYQVFRKLTIGSPDDFTAPGYSSYTVNF